MITRRVIRSRVTKKEYYAYLIEDTNECKDFFKIQFNWVVIPSMIGTYIIANSDGDGMYHFCTEEGLHDAYVIMGVDYISNPKETNSTVAGVCAGKTLAVNTDDDRLMERVAEKLRDIYGVKTDRVTQACSESDPIQKITVDDVAKLRKELFKEKLDKAVQNIRLDVPSLYPNICRSPSINMCNWLYGWPTSCHLDIRDWCKEQLKAKEKTTMKTSITLNIKKVIFNDPATIVIWADGTKTVVKCKEGETYSKWAGLALCYAKRINGEKFHAEFKRWCKEDEETTEETGYSSGSAYSIADGFAEIGKNARTCLDTLAKAFNGDNSIDYRDVIFKNRDDAKRIIDDVNSVVREFGSISLGNYCDMVGASHKLSDYYIGWTGTDKVGILTVKNGYKIVLPEPGSIQPTVAANHVKNFNTESAIDEIKRTK